MLFLLCFLLVFNFCLKPYTVEAAFPAVIGGKLLTFLLAMAAAGVTLSVAGKSDGQLVAEANSLLQHFEENYGQIQFWQDVLLNYLKEKGYQGINSFTSLLSKIKDWVLSLGATEGFNSFNLFGESEHHVLNGVTGEVYIYGKFQSYGTYTASLYNCDGVGLTSTWTVFYDSVLEIDQLTILNTYSDGSTDSMTGIVPSPYMFMRLIILSGTNSRIVATNGNWGVQANYWDIAAGGTVIPQPVESEPIPVNVDSDSYPLTGIPPNYYHKPNVLPPPLPTTTWDMTTGRNVTTWPGTAEDFADGFADTVTWDDYRDVVAGVPSVPYSFDETVPGTLTIDYDYDYTDEGAGAIPVPYPDAYEGDIPSEGLLQGITNWLTSLINTILGIPAKLIELLKQLLITLFVPDSDFMQNKMNDVNLKIGSKIGDNDYMNFLDSLKSLEGEPIPDGYIGNNKVFDASYVNNLADMVKLWQRWFWYILIVLWYMNNVYKMIRGSDAVRGMEYDAHRGGAKS